MTMEKYGVKSVLSEQRGALESAKRRLESLLGAQGGLEKTAAQDEEISRLKQEIADLESAVS